MEFSHCISVLQKKMFSSAGFVCGEIWYPPACLPDGIFRRLELLIVEYVQRCYYNETGHPLRLELFEAEFVHHRLVVQHLARAETDSCQSSITSFIWGPADRRGYPP